MVAAIYTLFGNLHIERCAMCVTLYITGTCIEWRGPQGNAAKEWSWMFNNRSSMFV